METIKNKSSKSIPIRVGDKFIPIGMKETWSVIETLPGGHIELFCKETTRFLRMPHKVVKTWPRA